MKTAYRCLSLLGAVLLLAGCKKESLQSAIPANDIAETRPALQVAVTADVNASIGGFYQALPARYDSTTKKYPLLLFLHGVGEIGNGSTDLPKLLVNAVPRLLNEQRFPPQFQVNGSAYSFIVINPQFNTWPQPSDINAMIDYAIVHYRVDESRIYISGLSMGGGGTWDYAVAYAGRAAAIVPISGAAWPSKEEMGNIARANLPVWAFHNNDDGVVDVNTTIANVNNVNAFSPPHIARKTIWPSGGHDAWTRATDPGTRECNGLNMYEWMLQFKKTTTH